MSKNRCPKCGHPVDLKEGRFRLFFGCSNFPLCTFTVSYYDIEVDEFSIDRYEEYLLNKELDAVVMESEHGDWGCRDED